MRDKIIKVYSSNGTLIASFDGDIVDTPENQKEKIYNPHISIDEDNSTATFEVYKDSNVWRTISSESEIYEIDGRRYFIYGEPSQISDDNLIRVTLKEIWNELDTKYVQAYNVEGSLEYLAEYTVSLVPFGSYPLVVNGATKTNPFTRDNLGYYIWALLQDTGYSITYCDVVDDTYDDVNLLSAYQLETEGLTVLENLKQLKELTDCLFKWDTVNKTLAVYDRNLANSEQNKWQGYEIREGVNLKSIEKRKNTNITTRVIPYGSDNLTIASVNDELLYLDNTSYSTKIYTKIINNPDIESPQALKCWAEKELAKMCRPTVEYEVDFVKRSDGEYAVETFNLYDIVRIIYFDKELGAEVVDDQRIISLNYDVWKNSAFVAKLGDKTLRWEQKLKQAIQDGKKSGTVISSSGIISAGNIVYGRGTSKRRIDTVIAEIDAKADENGAYVNLLALYANDTQGIKSAPTDTDKTAWNTLYTYYAINSQKFYKYNSTITIPDWEETKPISSSLATIMATADADRASINLLTEWQSGGKNKLNTNRNTEFSLDRNPNEPMQFTENMVIKGMSADGYIRTDNINSYALGEGTVSFSSKSYAYGIGFPLKVNEGEKYTISSVGSGVGVNVHFADINCMPISYSFAVQGFTIPQGAEWIVLIFIPSSSLNTTLTVSNIQLEIGEVATAYELYKGSAIKSIADVTQKADKNGASIGLVVENGSVKGSVLLEAINDDQSALTINADKINLTGYVTINSLKSDGTTEIDGSRIKTGNVQSSTYAYSSGNFSTNGMQISLDGAGYIRSKNFAIDGSGNAYLKGNIEATSGRLANWIIESDYIASYDENDPTVSPKFYLNSYANVSPYWIKATDEFDTTIFSVSKSGSAYFKGEIEAASGSKIGNFEITENGNLALNSIDSETSNYFEIKSTNSGANPTSYSSALSPSLLNIRQTYYGGKTNFVGLGISNNTNVPVLTFSTTDTNGLNEQKFSIVQDYVGSDSSIIFLKEISPTVASNIASFNNEDIYFGRAVGMNAQINKYHRIINTYDNSSTYMNILHIIGYNSSNGSTNTFLTMDYTFSNNLVSVSPQVNNFAIGTGASGKTNTLHGTWYCNGSLINGSDRKLKNSIDILPQKFETMFDNLQPKMFKYNEGTSGRLHAGFIVDEVQNAMTKAGITEKEFAAVCTMHQGTENEVSGLRYEEFIPLNTWEIQKLKTRIKTLEQRISNLENK